MALLLQAMHVRVVCDAWGALSAEDTLKGTTTPDLRRYTREDLASTGHGFPDRGPICERCRTHVPQFADLSGEDEARVRELIERGESVLAMRELERGTACSPRWAKIWVIHRGRPHPRFEGPPCPECGKATSRSKQCLSCGADWHTS